MNRFVALGFTLFVLFLLVPLVMVVGAVPVSYAHRHKVPPPNSISSEDSSLKHIIPDVFVSGGCSTSKSGNAEVEQAVDPRNGYIYEEWMGCTQAIGFARSIDGGKSFETSYTVPGSESHVTIINSTTAILTYSWDPSIAVSRNGTVYAAFMHGNVTVNLTKRTTAGLPLGSPFVAVSYDHGANFSSVSEVRIPAKTEFNDRDWIAVSPSGTIYVTWDHSPNASSIVFRCTGFGGGASSCGFGGGDLNAVISNSTNGGKTWGAMRGINPDYPNGSTPSAYVMVEPSCKIDVLLLRYSKLANNTFGNGSEDFTTSTDGGATWSQPVPLLGGDGSLLIPGSWWVNGALSRDRSGILYATFDTLSTGQDNAWITYSLNDGRSWASAVRLNPVVDSNLHIEVGVSGAKSGTAYVAWHLISSTTGGWSTYLQVLHVVAGNKSVLSEPILVSNQTGLGGVWGGDTLGITSLGANKVAVSWGYGVTLNGTNSSQIFETVVHLRSTG